jgi:hypothetical protein
LLLIGGLLGELISASAHQLLDMLRGLGGQLPGLLTGHAGDVVSVSRAVCATSAA